MTYITTNGSTPGSDPILRISGTTMTADASHLTSSKTATKTIKVGISGNAATSIHSVTINVCSISMPTIPNMSTQIGISNSNTFSVTFSDP